MREEPERLWVWRDAFQNMRVAKSKPAGEASVEYVRVDRLPTGATAPAQMQPQKQRAVVAIVNRASRPKIIKAPGKRKVNLVKSE